MLENTKAIIKAAAAGDPTITPELLKAGLDAMSGEGVTGLTDGEPLDATMTREQVAAVLGVNTRSVTRYAAQGLIVPFRIGKSKRSTGYSRRSVRELQERMREEAKARAAG